jgi:hypothetical protein
MLGPSGILPHCRLPSLRTHEVGEATHDRCKLENLLFCTGHRLLRAKRPRNDDCVGRMLGVSRLMRGEGI